MRAADTPLRLAVLASGRGSNLQAILDAIASGRLRAEVVGVFSDRPQAPVLQKVDEAQRWSASPRDFADRAAFDDALGDAIAASQPDWVVCAGYMRILGEPLVRRFAGRMLNIHPSLLPKYRGLHTHARALESGDAEHGASVHLVVPELDAGTVIAQARVPVLPDDTAEQLAARVLAREHPLLLATLDLLASGRVEVHRDSVHIDGQCLFTPLRLESDDTALA
ncbi:phosphoribosylglycinamide formyltransferase [Xanthomonas hortorum]|uniref:Phosphoribosylglycinamide formyltransferase n=2 Tax=Xanthomonas hortorum TaxID=56454 RepID=A0A6V7CNN5_9XANT|nr:phosphoribosylglycinamide formyltransferase [Xanthomonas hortorum]MCE4356131.1 phosphoribosylglycinamide formyltransferase [Xanthomonas hortorum pv. pelargonii]MCM5526473.1 phosphoribosylglycinamide formyltransferase [Xanthomonas hortorum pv. pelargonii]MCM5538496.1 phosphoribosylglycinamide formyltransferase [Xanthomonas hortorum pv. pelargonii]MCM5542713.1 phosphoribosylglycinamide formyltransferase [Xanthomonas hortorum pv. pelargonii]MCM5546739.1 phosphoribosylglycinamide formyltransfer